MIDVRRLIQAGTQFGHQHKWGNPKSRRFLWGTKNGVDLIDVSQTAFLAEKAAKFLESIAAEGKEILWCGTKKAAQKAITHVEQEQWPIVKHRWVGGTFTNPDQVRKAVRKLAHNKDILAKSDRNHFTKKELSVLYKATERLSKTVGGIESLKWPVSAVVVVDIRKEHVAVREAIASGIPVVALVDTNASPDGILYPIPANDDGEESISVIIEECLLKAASAGREQYRATQKVVPEKDTPSEVHSTQDKNQIEMQLAAVEASLDQEERPAAGARKASPSRQINRRSAHRSSRSGDSGVKSGNSRTKR